MNVDQFAEENGIIFEDGDFDEEPDEEIIYEIAKELVANEQAE